MHEQMGGNLKWFRPGYVLSRTQVQVRRCSPEVPGVRERAHSGTRAPLRLFRAGKIQLVAGEEALQAGAQRLALGDAQVHALQ
jgi:hypothetical protein